MHFANAETNKSAFIFALIHTIKSKELRSVWSAVHSSAQFLCVSGECAMKLYLFIHKRTKQLETQTILGDVISGTQFPPIRILPLYFRFNCGQRFCLSKKQWELFHLFDCLLVPWQGILAQ